jgi:paraquat-inducible protein B
MNAEGPPGRNGNGKENGEGEAAVPQAVVRSRAQFSVVWLIPLIAAVVGLFLAYRAYSERGPTISITFEHALGLEAGTTRVKFKEVDIGLVEAVEVSQDLAEVVITASLVAGSERYLTENTRFWVVRAEVTAGQISGISTVFSGAYIAIDPSTEGTRAHQFVGLEKAPVVTFDKTGSLFNLRADTLGSVDVGSPVYFRWLRVGEVAGYELDDVGDQVNLQIFVDSPHDERVRSTTRFWNASGLDAVVNAQGLQVDTPSLVSMLVGGIAFETPATLAVAQDVAEDQVFDLYPNKQATRQTRYATKTRYILNFDESVSGLIPGSAVEFRGIQIGEVEDVQLELEPVSMQIRIPVVIEIEPERFGQTGQIGQDGGSTYIHELVAKGLRARIKTANLLTGMKAVDFELVEDAEPAEILLGDRYPELPTSSGSFEGMTTRIARIVDRVDRVPIESIGQNLDEVLVSLRGTLDEIGSFAGTANEDLMPSLASSLENLEKTLQSADSMIAPDAALPRELERLIIDLAEAARSIRLLADRLEEHPEELLRGKQE